MSSRLQNAMLIGEKRQAAQTRWWVWAVAIFAVTCSHLAIAGFALLDGYDRGRVFERQKISDTPKPAQGSCKELARICADEYVPPRWRKKG